MFSYIDKIASLMSEADKNTYEQIFAPREVLVPTMDSRREMCVCRDGEIRVYGSRDRVNSYDEFSGIPCYHASRDGGISWKLYDCKEGDIGPCVYVPWTDKYITVFHKNGNKPLRFLSDIGPGDTNPDIAPINDEYVPGWDIFQPFVDVKSKRIFVPCYHRDNEGCYHPRIYTSYDGGVSFEIKQLVNPPRFKMEWPHKGPRWENNGSEPSMTRLSDGRLWIVIRTSTDYMYEYFSYDDGDTWSDPTPSRFHMTLTTPFVYTLHDGRSVLLWNNTHPLPEIDKETYEPAIFPTGKTGFWEDFFTNRDVAHAAITEDGGNTFIGYRETLLNVARNSTYFRAFGDHMSGGDKSVHQHQAIELPYGKLLVSSGQHSAARRVYIFDIKWLYETEAYERFLDGLDHVTTHGYIKSICEAHPDESTGHCQWNRYNTVLPMPDPAGSYREVMQFCYNPDRRLWDGTAGMAWNFPISKSGRVEIEVYRQTDGLRVSLCDCWINPTDTTVNHYAKFTLEADERVLPENKWVTLALDFDTDKNLLVYSVDGEKLGEVSLNNPVVDGVCYLHLQTLAKSCDYKGAYVRSMRKR